MKTATQALRDAIFTNNVHAWADLFSFYFAGGGSRRNAVRYSRDLRLSPWFGECVVTSNTTAVAAPDGSFTACKVAEGNGGTATLHRRYQGSLETTLDLSGDWTASTYVKAGERSRFTLFLYNNAATGNWIQATVNLATGTISSGRGGNGVTSAPYATLTPDVDGWYRVTITGKPDTTVTGGRWQVQIRLANDAGATTYVGDGVSGLYVWGVQVEPGTVATPVIQTGVDPVTVTGEPRRWTTAGANVDAFDSSGNGRTFVAGEVAVPRPTSKVDAKLEAAEVELRIAALETVTVGGLKLPAAAARGLFDSARVVVERAALATDGSVIGTLVLFDGAVEDVSPSSSGVVVTATSPVARLAARTVPLRVVQASCPFKLYDAATCGLSEAAWTDARTAAAGSTASVVVLSSSSTRAEPGGCLTIAGERRAVRAVNGASVTVDVPFTAAPAVGAAVNVTAGCDRKRTTCGAKGNIGNFGGLPDVPASEDA